MEHLPEKDWKIIKSLQKQALNHTCERVLENIHSLIESDRKDHKAYRKIWNILRKEDKKISLMFDDVKRRTAIFKLAMWKEDGVLSDQDFAELTEETQDKINKLIEMKR